MMVVIIAPCHNQMEGMAQGREQVVNRLTEVVPFFSDRFSAEQVNCDEREKSKF